MSTSTHHLDLSSSVIAVSLISGGAMGLGLGTAYSFDWLFAGLGVLVGLLVGLLISLATVRCCDWLRRRIEAFAGAPVGGKPGRPLLLAIAIVVELVKIAAPLITMSVLVVGIDIVKSGAPPF